MIMWYPEENSFRWLEGMTCCVLSEDNEPSESYPILLKDGVPMFYRHSGFYPISENVYLTDSPTTRGALLSLVRERFPRAFVSVSFNLTGLTKYSFESGESARHYEIRDDSEFRVLLSALALEKDESPSPNLVEMRQGIDALSRILSTYSDLIYVKGNTDPYIKERLEVIIQQVIEAKTAYKALASRGVQR